MSKNLGSGFITVSPDGAGFSAKAQALVSASLRTVNGNVKVGADTTAAQTKIAALSGGTATLQKQLANMRIGVSDSGALAKIVALQARAVALSRTLGSTNAGNPSAVLGAESKYLSIAAAIEKVSTASSDATKSTSLFGTAMAALQHHTELYGGALTGLVPEVLSSVSGWHMLTEAVIETVAVWGPATVAVGAFGIAAYATGKQIYEQFTNMYTVSKALGVSIPGLSGSFAKMSAAAKPQVIQLLGDALLIAQHNTGTFGAVASSTGNVLDKLGARIVAAFQGAQSSGKFAQVASQDLQMLGTAFGDLFGLIGALLKDVPGYATILLKLGTGVLGMAESFVQAAGPVLKLGLAAHGAIIYLGLLSTGVTKLVTGGLGGIANLALKGAQAVDTLGPAGATAAKGLTTFGAAVEGAAALPWGWISIAAGLFVYFADRQATATDATEKWIQAQQSAVQQASLSNVLTQNGAALAAVNLKLASSTATYEKSVGGATSAQQANSKAMQESSALINPVTGSFSALGQQVVKASSNVTELTDAQKAFNAQGALVSGRMTQLSQQFGGNASAMALMNAAGITTAEVTDKNNQNWQQSVIMMEAQEAGFKELQLGSGRYGAAVNDLSNNLVTYDATMGKIVTAQQTLMTTITGGETAFTSFAQGLNTLKTDADKGKVGIGGLSTASLQMSSDFYSSVNAGESLIGSLENQGITTKNLTKATATMAGQMLAYAGNNTAAQSTVISLINSAIGPGTVSFKNLQNWVSKNSTSMSGLNNIVAQTTVAAAGMAGAIDNATKILFEQYLMTSSNVTPALKKYADALVNSGTQSEATSSARQQLIKDLEKTGLTASQAKTQVNSLTQGLNNLPKNTTASIEAQLRGTGQIKATDTIMGGSTNLGELNFARGGVVPGGSSGGDNHLAMVKSGELIIPSQHAPKFADMARTAGISGFSAGGVVGGATGALNTLKNLVPTSSQFATGFAQSATQQFVKALQSAQTTSGGGGPNSKGVATSAQVVAWISKALDIDHAPQSWLPLMEKLVSLESGGNATAVDPILVGGENATGIAQMLPSTFAANAVSGYGNIDNGLDNLVASIRYIQARYGSPAAIPGIGTSAHYVGYSAGGVTPEGILGIGTRSGTPYTIGSGEYVGPLMGNSAAAMGMSGNAGMLVPILQEQNRILKTIAKQNQGAPAAYARSLNGAVGGGANRAWSS